MRSKPHQFVIVMKSLSADGLRFCFLLRLGPCVVVRVPWDPPFICERAHSHIGFIYAFFLFLAHIGKHGCGHTACALYAVCIAIAFSEKKNKFPHSHFPFGEPCCMQIIKIICNLH